jgi:hypothetical protein
MEREVQENWPLAKQQAAGVWKMKRNRLITKLFGAALLALLIAPGAIQAATFNINFDDGPPGSDVTSDYPEVLFRTVRNTAVFTDFASLSAFIVAPDINQPSTLVTRRRAPDPFFGVSDTDMMVVSGAAESAPGDHDILMTFTTEMVAMSLIGMPCWDAGCAFPPFTPDTQNVRMTLFDSAGAIVAQQEFPSSGLIPNTIPVTIGAAGGFINALFQAVGQNPPFGSYGFDSLSGTTKTTAAVPEPMSLSLIGIGVAGLALLRKRKA